MEWKRARTPKQKALREQTILRAAEDLFAQLDYQAVSLNAIARQAGFAKANVYRYFSTREEIFLQIFGNRFTNWAEELSKALRMLGLDSHSKVIAQTWVHVTVKHRDLLDLTPFLHAAVEKNSSIEALLKFDAAMDAPTKQIEQALQCVVPGMSKESIFRLIIYFHSLTAGLWPLSRNNEIRDEVLKRSGDPSRRIDYEDQMTQALQMLIEGLRQETDERRKNTSETNGSGE